MVTFAMITPTVAVIALVIALILFGPGKLPELGKGLGKGIKEFKDATDLSDDDGKKKKKEIAESKKEEPAESKKEEPVESKE
ncbi:sec-independent protein translocase protein TatA [Desulfitobacterium sp. LBE]|nr:MULTISPECIES: twin-arginine translocase TatA/TatE family subunit [Desulfitobacterium]ACL18299.1 twin-arginine translocation protein, TatA/E family subunit [Desulfitobacterium hafniense DCB-2]EHL09077.1 twin arginine-targeting protein translocase, TatA/E family [Desulfitobacterium hafniense DP7]KTE92354.1 preprotein translocase subunit TatA [Desulfitobacterium hafniense]MEA5024438.1 twin-arginine translocase TatA/TatE family subunit [Desulfitobacterium hafniense]TWH58790.1 sec-independent pr